MATKIQVRRDTAANWTSVNPTLSAGEWGLETDTGRAKIGDGTTAWATLVYSTMDAIILATITGGLTAKATPIDADKIGFWDSVTSAMRNFTFANLWTWIKAKFTSDGVAARTALDVDSKSEVTGKASSAKTAAEATAAGALAGHVSDADPHAQYQKEEAGKGLSTNNYSDEEKSKVPTTAEKAHLAAIEAATGTGTAEKLMTLLTTLIKALFGFVANAVGFELAGGDASKKLTVSADADTKDIPTTAGKADADAIGAAEGTTLSERITGFITPSVSRIGHRFARLLGHKLKSATESMVISMMSDSTSNEIWEWFYLAMAWLAGLYPAYTFIHRLWSDTTQSYSDYDYDSPGVKVIQYGTAGDGYALCGGGRAVIGDTATLRITGDLEIIAKIACDDYSHSAEQTIVSKMGDSGNYGWSLFIDIYGYPKLWWSSDGSNSIIKSADAPIPVSNGASVWLKATIDVDNGSSGNTVKFYTSSNGTNWTQLSTSVVTAGVTSIYASTADIHIGSRGTSQPLIGKIYRVFVKNGIAGKVVASPDFGQAYPSIVTTFPDLEGNAVTKTGTITWGNGAPCVIIANASVSGQTAAYFNNEARFALVTAHEPLLQFVSLSHNEMTTVDYTTYRTLIAAIAAKYPNSGIVLCAQNPQQTPLVYIDHHAIRCGQVAQYAVVNDYGLIDAFAAFKALGDFSGYMADGAHPNAAGTALWATEAKKYLIGAL